MRKGLLFNTGRAAALASLLGMPCASIIGVRSARAAPVPGEHYTGVEAPQEVPVFGGGSDGLVFDFWNLVWGFDFVPGESSMLLWELLAPDVWLVQVTDAAAVDDPFVAQGILVEAGREHLDHLAWSAEMLDEAGLLGADHYFVAGALGSLTGFQSAAVFMLLVATFPGEHPGDEPVEVRVLTPVELVPDLATALAEIEILANLHEVTTDTVLSDLPMPVQRKPDKLPFTTCGSECEDEDDVTPNTCRMQHGLCIDACALEGAARNLICTGLAITAISACIYGCSFTGPGYPLCASLCIAASIIVDLACLASSHLDFRACLTNCWISRLMCESQ